MKARMMALVMIVAGCGGNAVTPPATTPMGRPPMALVPPVVPAELAVPEGHKLVLIARATGVQIYECAPDASGALGWKLHAPRADLLDDAETVIGSHYGGVDKGLPPGPYWASQDGSRVHGAKPVSAPHEGSIPLLRLEAAEVSGPGVLGKITFVQRLETTGGGAPAGACDAGKPAEVPYTAKYYFYAAR